MTSVALQRQLYPVGGGVLLPLVTAERLSNWSTSYYEREREGSWSLICQAIGEMGGWVCVCVCVYHCVSLCVCVFIRSRPAPLVKEACGRWILTIGGVCWPPSRGLRTIPTIATSLLLCHQGSVVTPPPNNT